MCCITDIFSRKSKSRTGQGTEVMKPSTCEGDPIGWYLAKYSEKFWYLCVAGVDLKEFFGEEDASHNVLVHL